MQATIERMNGPAEAKFGKKYGFLINGQWHDFFTKYPLYEGVGPGATLDIEVEQNGTFNPKIKRMKVVTPSVTGYAPSPSTASAPAGAAGHTERELSIMRQNAMTNANTFLSYNNSAEGGSGYTLKELLETATILTGFYAGDLTHEDLTQESEKKPTVAELAKAMAS